MVNSGSSANLIALSVLALGPPEDRIQAGDEMITPAVTWSTTVFPIVGVGAVPVLVDVDPSTLTVDVNARGLRWTRVSSASRPTLQEV